MVAPDRIDVVDQLNNKRLLGSVPKPYQKLTSPYYSFAFCSSSYACVFDPNLTPAVTNVGRIDMVITWIDSEDSWTKRAAFATYSHLKDLLQVRDFRLPGESDEAAYYRGWMH